MQILVFDHIVFSIFGPGWGAWARGLAASSSTAAPVIGSQLEIVQMSEKNRAMLYSTAASDGGYMAL